MTRKRELETISYMHEIAYSSVFTPTNVARGVDILTSHSTSYDEVHPGYKTNRGGSGDVGGPFDLQSEVYTKVTPAPFSGSLGSYNYYNCAFIPRMLNVGFSTTFDVGSINVNSELSLLGLGATAIARTIPTSPAFGLSRSIGEIRNDGLPTLMGLTNLKRKTQELRHIRSFGKGAGNDYLSAQFGWAPFVSDLLGLARSVKNSNKTIHQYIKSSDSKIKRRYNFPIESHLGVRKGNCHVSPMANVWFDGAQEIESVHQTGFSGAFKYHIPLGDDLSSKMIRWESEANKLLGLRLTPKLVWDLAPWTWAVDWFSNVGDIMKNISSLGSDGLVLQYGYLMDSQIMTDHLIASHPAVGQCERTLVSKNLRRRQAHWWGFNVDISALTLKQDAIVVALGLSHGLR